MEDLQLVEQLDTFFLGKEIDLETQALSSTPFFYKNKYLTTHAAIIGMTGSGKTGLGIGLIEEAAMDNIPVIVIDPKGDMGNLMLAFPELRPEDFLPWVDPSEAEARGITPYELSKKTASLWRKGLKEWGQGPSRISRFLSKAERRIYTPGALAGTPVSILGNFAPPGRQILDDVDTLNSLIDSTVTGLLALCGQNIKPLSREHLLLSSLFLHFWRRGQALTLESLIGNIINPPFERLGILPLETIFPSRDRMELAMAFNTVLASPGFSAWLQGEPLDISRFLYNQEGRPKISIFTLSHLTENERQFFVTILLNRFLNWLRRQQGTSNLRVLLYMDEISGYFPPVVTPPTKRPMLLLLKQARAFGAGIVLSTQNPVDLDYKGLSNIGTWFIGRLQTRQDQDRVIDGLKSASSKALEEAKIRNILSALPKRTFFMRSVHLERPVIFQTRWVMSYLRGPLTLKNIKELTKRSSIETTFDERGYESSKKVDVHGQIPESFSARNVRAKAAPSVPVLSGSIPQYYLVPPILTDKFILEPYLVATGKVRFFNSRRNIDLVQKKSIQLFLDDSFKEPDWSLSEPFESEIDDLSKTPPANSVYSGLPESILSARNLNPFLRSLRDYLYHNSHMELFRVKRLKLESKIGQDMEEFRQEVIDHLKNKRAEAIERIEARYKKQFQRLEARLNKALARLDREKEDVSQRGVDTVVSFGVAILGALFGRKTLSATTAYRTGRGIRNASRMMREKEDVKRAEEEIARLREKMDELQDDLHQEIEKISERFSIDNYEIESFYITPRRNDIFDTRVFLLWRAVPGPI